MSRLGSLRWLAPIALVISFSGCGKPDGRRPVSGEVILHNEPVADGIIDFEPLDGQPTKSGAQILNGKYEIPKDKGLVPGKYRDIPNAPVRIRIGTVDYFITSHNYVINYGNTSFFQAPLNGIAFGGAPFHCYPPQWLTPSQQLLTDYTQNHPDHDKWGRFGPSAGQPQVTLLQISNNDGTSSTLMLSETIQGQGSDLRGFTWWGGSSGFTTWSPPNANEPDVLMGGSCNVVGTRALEWTPLNLIGAELLDWLVEEFPEENLKTGVLG